METSIIFSTNRKRIIAALITTFFLTTLLGISHQFYGIDWRLGGICILTVVMSGLAILIDIECHGRAKWLEDILILVFLSFLSYMLFETFEGSDLTNFDLYYQWRLAADSDFAARSFLNLAICSMVFIFLYLITGRVRLAFILGSVFTFLGGLGSYFVLQFRGESVLYSDLLSMRTAMSVAGAYDYQMSTTILVAGVILVTMLLWSCKAGDRVIDKIPRRRLRLGVGVFFMLALVIFLNSNVEGYYYAWKPTWNGHAYQFAINAKLTKVRAPKGYDSDTIPSLVPETGQTPDTTTAKPNIIAIMNESFADLSCLGNFETTVDYMPYYHSLKENVIKGNVYVTPFGGGTCDSEYSFLTGNTTAYLADNARPYQLYVNGTTPSLVSTLNDQGYESHAIHPGMPSAWNRDRVYPDLGFKSFTTQLNIPKPDYVRDAYISDETTYRTIIDHYENKGADPLFVFDVTIQNHGGYELDGSALEPVKLIGMEDDYPDVEQYLSLIRKSDAAFKELTAYFEAQAEPTLILMFGDHLPYLNEDFFAELTGMAKEDLDLETLQQRYATPFVLWANYDIDTAEIDKLSINYLSSLLLSQTNLESTRYNAYLLEMAKSIPVINKNGIIDNENNYFSLTESSPWSETLLEYQQLIYNNIFDTSGRDNAVFYIDPTDK